MMHPHRCARPAYTLMELLVASAAGAILLGGMASSVYVASQALDVTLGSEASKSDSSRAIERIIRDVRHARHFSERTATAMTFSVPDRNGDGEPETIRYAWSGTSGDPLTCELNGQPAGNMLDKVTNLDFTYAIRTLEAREIVDPPMVTFAEFSEIKTAGQDDIEIELPSGVDEGDLLVAAFATDGDTSESLIGPDGWTLVHVDQVDSAVTLGVWWRIATGSEPQKYSFGGLGEEHTYGWIMRFTGHDASNPINAYNVEATPADVSATPESPEVVTSVPNTLIVRLGGFDRDSVTEDSTGLSGHTTITMDASNNGEETVSGGAGCAMLTAAGNSGVSAFSLTAPRAAVAITLAIAPQESP